LVASVAEPLAVGVGGSNWPRRLELTEAPKALPETDVTSAEAGPPVSSNAPATSVTTPTVPNKRRFLAPGIALSRSSPVGPTGLVDPARPELSLPQPAGRGG
jgi:hypothetical protein